MSSALLSWAIKARVSLDTMCDRMKDSAPSDDCGWVRYRCVPTCKNPIGGLRQIVERGGGSDVPQI